MYKITITTLLVGTIDNTGVHHPHGNIQTWTIPPEVANFVIQPPTHRARAAARPRDVYLLKGKSLFVGSVCDVEKLVTTGLHAAV